MHALFHSNSHVRVRVNGQCENPVTKVLEDTEEYDTIKVKGSTYGKFHYLESVRENILECGETTENCMMKIRTAAQANNDPFAIMKEFNNCFRGNINVQLLSKLCLPSNESPGLGQFNGFLLLTQCHLYRTIFLFWS